MICVSEAGRFFIPNDSVMAAVEYIENGLKNDYCTFPFTLAVGVATVIVYENAEIINAVTKICQAQNIWRDVAYLRKEGIQLDPNEVLSRTDAADYMLVTEQEQPHDWEWSSNLLDER